MIPLEAARLAEAVYLPAPAARAAAGRAGYWLDRWWDRGDTQVALFRRWDDDESGGPERAMLVFRGTSIVWGHAVSDLWSNLTWPWGAPWDAGGRVHGGYAAALYDVARAARELAEDVASDIPLHVAGHSMGGALATLYAAWCDHRLAGAITFGAPKVGRRSAFSRIACPVDRYVTAWDWAPHWPPLVFSHPAPAIRLESAAPLWRRHTVESYIDALLGR